MTNLQRIAVLSSQIRNLIAAEGETETTFTPNTPLDEMWRGVEQISKGLARAKASTGERTVA